MTDTNPTDFDVSDAALDRAGVFGYDSHGQAHKYDSVRAQVIVTDDDGVAHVEHLARDRVVEWINYVADARGWIDQWWTVDDAAEAMRRQEIARAQAADRQYQQAIEAKPEREVSA